MQKKIKASDPRRIQKYMTADQLSLACALLGIVLVTGRLRSFALAMALLGLGWMIVVDKPPFRVSHRLRLFTFHITSHLRLGRIPQNDDVFLPGGEGGWVGRETPPLVAKKKKQQRGLASPRSQHGISDETLPTSPAATSDQSESEATTRRQTIVNQNGKLRSRRRHRCQRCCNLATSITNNHGGGGTSHCISTRPYSDSSSSGHRPFHG